MTRAIIVCLLGLNGMMPGMAQTKELDPVDRLIVSTRAEFDMAAGTAVVVVQGDRVVYEGYFGFADVAERMPVTDQTVFYIASLTKPFFALATLLEIDDGRLSADDKLAAAGERRLEAARRVQETVNEAVRALHALLDEEQREDLADLIRTGGLRL